MTFAERFAYQLVTPETDTYTDSLTCCCTHDCNVTVKQMNQLVEAKVPYYEVHDEHGWTSAIVLLQHWNKWKERDDE